MIGLEPTTVCEGAECLDIGDAEYGIANLWPEPADPRPGFHEKDQVENTLQQAQSLIAHDWFGVYQTMPK